MEMGKRKHKESRDRQNSLMAVEMGGSQIFLSCHTSVDLFFITYNEPLFDLQGWREYINTWEAESDQNAFFSFQKVWLIQLKLYSVGALEDFNVWCFCHWNGW